MIIMMGEKDEKYTCPFTINKSEVNMRNPFLCLVVLLLFFIGCYNTRLVTKEELKAKAKQVDITVWAKDSLEFKFLKDNYSIQGDTLTGIGVQAIGGNDERFHGSISFADITSFKMKEFNIVTTIVAIGLPIMFLKAYVGSFIKAVATEREISCCRGYVLPIMPN